MGAYRKSGKPSKGLHIRLSDETAEWLDEEAERRMLSRARLVEIAVERLRVQIEEGKTE